MTSTLRRVLWSLSLTATVALGVALAWNAGRCDGYPSRGVDVTDRIDGESWALYAVEYARSAELSLDRLVEGAEPHETVDMSWYFWVAVGHDRVVLIDTGTDRFADRPEGKTATRWSVRRSRSVLEALSALGLEAADVTDVVLTHSHWDHVEGLRHFEHATAHVHAGEWAALDGAEFGGRVATFDVTPASPIPDLTVLEAGRHTPHHCVVELACEGGAVVVGGDGAYLYRNLEEASPISVTRSREGNVGDMHALIARVGDSAVLPGHDPEVFERYESPREGIARICP